MNNLQSLGSDILQQHFSSNVVSLGVAPPVHLRPLQPPPPPRLDEPRALADLAPHPPPSPPPKVDDPPLFSCPPHPREAAELELELLGFWTLFQLPFDSFCQPLPVFLYAFPLAAAYLLPFAV